MSGNTSHGDTDEPIITTREIQDLAALSMLQLTDEEVQLFRRDLRQILEYVSLLEQVDGASHVVDEDALGTVLRSDTAESSLSPTQVQANAPDFREGYFVVPRILPVP